MLITYPEVNWIDRVVCQDEAFVRIQCAGTIEAEELHVTGEFFFSLHIFAIRDN